MENSMVTDDLSWSIVDIIKQSPPVNVKAPYDTKSLAGKTILITGGASGFGAAFARKWAEHGSHIIIGDVNDSAGEDVIAELRSLPGSSKHHYYQHCDVTKWEDQVSLFKMAARASPTRGIDAVVASAGISEHGDVASGAPGVFDNPSDLDSDSLPPPPPPLNVFNVNLTGVMYTTHLALFWLPRNGGVSRLDLQDDTTAADDGRPIRDRHLLLVSSIAGLAPLPGQTEYTASKHGVLGLFRSLRATSWTKGIRCNVLCPYFVDTPIVPWRALALLAGGPKADIEDVVDAATRLMADEKVVGRGLLIGGRQRVVGGKLVVVDDAEYAEGEGGDGDGNREIRNSPSAVWEVHAHDYEMVEVFVYRFVKVLNMVRTVRGWVETLKDLWAIYLSRGRGGGRAAKAKAKNAVL
ncbi:NAD(P)-binding protein [Neurospora crassa]|nr:NAD(P)-binding protein [Neurospora crassa]